MAVFRVERTRDYTVMSNHHLKDMNLSLKAKGLLSMMLSLPDSWNYTTRGLAAICKEGVDAIGSAVRELEKAGYIVRCLLRGEGGRIADTEYVIYEQPQGGPDMPPPPSGGPDMASPHPGNPYAAGPDAAAPCAEKPVQLNTDPVSTDRSNTHLSRPTEGNARGAAGCSEQAVRFERERVRAQIEYDRIINVENREQVDEFVEIMLAASLTESPTILDEKQAVMEYILFWNSIFPLDLRREGEHSYSFLDRDDGRRKTVHVAARLEETPPGFQAEGSVRINRLYVSCPDDRAKEAVILPPKKSHKKKEAEH